jgi:carnosine N-methyltransferase
MLAEPPFSMLAHFDKVDDAIDANADIATAILHSGLNAFGVPKEPADAASEWRRSATPFDMEKAKSTIRQLYRDWSEEGASERNACYAPVLKDLQHLFPEDLWNTTKVLIPGAGLGRLVFEVCKLGFSAEGNEISFHQLISSNWVLNQVPRDQKYPLYPFALSFSNHLKRDNQLHCVSIPDVHPATELAQASQGHAIHAFERMSMTAADFIVLYSGEKYRNSFDAVVTVFFIDTAPNIIRYVETIYHTLRPGGYWINLGPLLWHFEDRTAGPSHDRSVSGSGGSALGIGEPGGVELALEDVLGLVERMGFSFQQREVLSPDVGYIQDPESMSTSRYVCSHFVAQRDA